MSSSIFHLCVVFLQSFWRIFDVILSSFVLFLSPFYRLSVVSLKDSKNSRKIMYFLLSFWHLFFVFRELSLYCRFSVLFSIFWCVLLTFCCLLIVFLSSFYRLLVVFLSLLVVSFTSLLPSF